MKILHNKKKAIGKKAVEEFNRVREEYDMEVQRRSEAEYVADTLRAEINKLITENGRVNQLEVETKRYRTDLNRLEEQRVLMENTINELKIQKEKLTADIEELMSRKHSETMKR